MAEIKRYLTPVFRVSFPNVFVAKPNKDGKNPKYGIAALWTPSKFTEKEKVLWRTILKALDAESQKAFKKPYKNLPANFKKGLRNGNEKPDLKGYGEGVRFANLTTKMKPGIIGRNKEKISTEEGNEEEIYAGVYCRATVTVYSYDNEGKGLALGLMNLQKVKDCKPEERLDNRVDAAEDFEDDLGDGFDDDNLLDGESSDDELPF